ncbi:MAG: calcium/sodium antiporter [Clostridia bacterium]|nr:calcium/sodium antiporter [Clostridia bacterium]NCD04058.1 calcium/sodium antiporter [Clostridia bacterium]
MMYLLLIIGFFLLIKGADYFVEGSSAIAKLLKVPSVVIGLTIVAMGTSAPEAAVSITAGLAGSNDLALSNVIGSNLFNLVLIVGVCALIRPFVVDKGIMKRDFPLAVLSSIILLFFIRDNYLSRIEGLILLCIMIAYLIVTVTSAIRNPVASEAQDRYLPMHTSLIYIGLGLAAIIFGGNLVVDNASRIAASFGLSETLIGLTIVAIGTSLPELVTSVTASRKGESGLALGNVVGSNLFNILFILGLSSTVHPISAEPVALTDILILIILTSVVFILAQSQILWDKGFLT